MDALAIQYVQHVMSICLRVTRRIYVALIDSNCSTDVKSRNLWIPCSVDDHPPQKSFRLVVSLFHLTTSEYMGSSPHSTLWLLYSLSIDPGETG